VAHYKIKSSAEKHPNVKKAPLPPLADFKKFFQKISQEGEEGFFTLGCFSALDLIYNEPLSEGHFEYHNVKKPFPPWLILKIFQKISQGGEEGFFTLGCFSALDLIYNEPFFKDILSIIT